MITLQAKDTYRLTSVFMILIIAGVQWGFYRPYLSQFPTFTNATPVIHIHGALLMGWMMLLVIQPLLINFKKVKLHRSIGKISWILGPMIIISMFLVGRGSYWRGLDFISQNPGSFTASDNLAVMVLDIRGFVTFAIFWALAMAYRKNSGSHMRYMIATGLLAIGPGVGRGLMATFDLSLHSALTITDVLDLLIAGVFIGYDFARKKDSKPYLIVFTFFLVGAILWQYCYSEFWQNFAQGYADLLY
ncbi:hypothetical protein DFQ04_2753 [Algoriphagus boseongensis]|uniref:Uncharacterized protein n=1 Tax=Algoriphagus boseongensis TaxID=1442587 RepID=A0A4R6T7G5_9BACT|nr:hypothetical protein [Algoriphagus boseongensis]TDQ16631.1 hypothetical protein DFQ04_2753 [Algoriphagus boseongensis]